MQLPAQDFLRLIEETKTLAIFDTESQGLYGDYGSVIVGSVKTINGPTESFRISQLGNDKRVVREIKDYLESFDAWVSYYGKGHDIPLLNTRLLRWGYMPIDPRPHIDLYFILRPNLRMTSGSQAHLLNFLGTSERKMTVSPLEWAELGSNFKRGMKILTERCESDCIGLEQLYKRTKHLIKDIKR